MTKDEAIEHLKTTWQRDDISVGETIAIKMAIKALEQESCEDCISRAEVLKLLEKEDWADTVYGVMALPPVTLKTRWIPCSERLPEACDTYLVSGVQEIDGEMVPFVDAADYPDSYIDGLWGTFNDWIEGNEVHVLAWQEMPEAWEDEE